MKRHVAILVCAALLLAVCVPSLLLAEKGSKPRIAVLEFKNKANNQWWFSNGASAAQDIFVTELVKSGKFRVVDREQLDALMREKNLTLSGDVDPKSAIRIGKLLGVNYLLTGAVTEYGYSEKGAHSGGLGRLPGFGVGKKEFTAAMNARLIDSNTGEVVWADEARGSESTVKVEVGGIGGGSEDGRMFDKVVKPVIQQLTASLKAADL
jgi:curli biogenesis system outer membrane secretion channel CsgG